MVSNLKGALAASAGAASSDDRFIDYRRAIRGLRLTCSEYPPLKEPLMYRSGTPRVQKRFVLEFSTTYGAALHSH